jgi:hypothetical protein
LANNAKARLEAVMKSRFIVLIDISEYSDQLIKFAYDWSKKINAKIVMVHSTPVILPALTSYESRKTLTANANSDALKKLTELTEAVIPQESSIRHLASEKPLVNIVRQLLEGHYSHLVFLGIKETGLLKKMFLGSEAVKIIDGIDNVIVAIPQNAVCRLPESIHVAVQKKYALNTFEFDKFLKFTGAEVKKIIFFSFITSADDAGAAEKYLKELVELYSDKRYATYELYRGQDELISLKKLITAKKNEFIVIQRGSRMLFDQIFRTFLVNELIYEGQTPLIILP